MIAALAITLASFNASAIPPNERCPQFEPIIREVGLPVEMFSYIAYRESRCDPKALGINAPGIRPDYGLFQIQGSWVTVTSQVCKSTWGNMKVLFSPKCNARVAAYLYKHGGTGHWKGSSGAYKRKANNGKKNP